MKVPFQYLNDKNRKPIAVELSLNYWGKISTRLKNHEQTLKIKADLEDAFHEVAQLRNSKENKQSLIEFLQEL